MKLSKNKIILVLMAVVLIMTIMNVSAVDVNDNANINDTNDIDLVLASDSSDNILSDGEGTYNELQTQINNADEGSNITLDKNYKYTTGDNINGITITKQLTINGNGKSIDGSNCARIFNITGDGVILNNIILKNGFINNTIHVDSTPYNNVNITSNGAGILWSGNNGTLNNSQIINTHMYTNVTFISTQLINATYNVGNGAGIYWMGNKGIIENTTFYNNTNYFYFVIKDNIYSLKNYNINRTIGSGIVNIVGNNSIIRKSKFIQNTINGLYNITNNTGRGINISTFIANSGVIWYGSQGIIEYTSFNNTFINCSFSDNYPGGAIQWYGVNGTVRFSNFTNNTLYNPIGIPFSGGIFWRADNGTISDCNFNNNKATGLTPFGGAITNHESNNLTITNSNFINNSAGNYGGAIFFWLGNVNSKIIDCNFTGNSAKMGGAILMQPITGLNITKCIFTNNSAIDQGGAIYWQGTNHVLTHSKFINNTASISNDIFGSNVVCDYNTFEGPFLINNNLVHGNSKLELSVRPCQYDVNVNLIIDNKDNIFTIKANTNGNTIIDLPEYFQDVGTKNIEIKFSTNGTNIYKNVSVSVNVVSECVIYASPDGVGNGSDYQHPTTLQNALKNIITDGTIIVLNGTYTGFYGDTISKTITIKGLGNTIFDGGNIRGIIYVAADNVTISDVTFIRTNDEYAIRWIGNNGKLINCNFINNTGTNNYGAVYVTGNNISISHCNFINNSANRGGAINIISNEGSVNYCNFINNSASSYSIIYCTGNVSFNYNNFTGNIDLYDECVIGNVFSNILFSDPSYDLIANVSINNENIGVFTIEANSDSTLLDFSQYCNICGEYNISVSFKSNGTNNFHVFNKIIWVVDDKIIYISPYGTGSGNNSNNPSNWDDAMKIIPIGGTIIMLNDTYFETYSNIVKPFINIKGSGNAIIDLSYSGSLTASARNITINNLYFRNANGASAIVWSGDYGLINNSWFINNHGVNGAGIRWSGSNGLIKNSNFINNSATDRRSGGAIYCTGSNTTVESCNFTNNKGFGFGGAIYCSANNVKILYCNFDNSTLNGTDGESHGGAITFFDSSHVVIDYCTFNNNYAGVQGGAIFTWSIVNNVTISNSNFTNNVVGIHGGALCMQTSSGWNIVNCIFVNNTANGRGGVLYSGSNNMLIKDCIFTNNTAVDGGGVLYIDKLNVTIMYCNFTNNTNKNESSGALFVIGRNCTLSYCNFINNSATRNNGDSIGGAIYWGGQWGNISFCNFEKNYVLGNDSSHNAFGGALCLNAPNCTISYSNFTSNYINNFLNPQGITGGALQLHSKGFKISYCIFTNNTAETGGAIFVRQGDSIIEYCNFTNNTAYTGGAIYWNNGANSVLNNSKFYYNAASNMNDVYINKDILLCDNNVFTGNYADIPDIVVAGYASLFMGIIPAQYDVNVTVTVNSQHKIFTIKANTVNSVEFDLSDLISEAGVYTIDFDFTSTGTNIYYSDSISLIVVNESIIYISHNGTNAGDDKDHPANWTYANDNIIAGGTIVFLEGNYTNISGEVINKPVIIKTLNENVIVDANYGNESIFIINANRVIISGIVFMNVNGSSAVVWNGVKGTLNNSIFVNNNATNAAAINWKGIHGLINNSCFINNTATGHTGAVIFGSTNGQILNSTFTDNSGAQGGALRGTGINITVMFSRFINNTSIRNTANSTTDGGAIYWDSSSDTGSTLINCTFKGNNATYRGGAIFWNAGVNATVINCSFEDNVAYGLGGHIYFNPRNPRVINSTFINGLSTSSGGGAIYLNSNNLIVYNCTFINNTGGSGGALNWGRVNASISKSRFINNAARGSGGAFNGGADNMIISECIFENNTAVNNGGAIYLNRLNVTIINCNFTGNNVTTTNTGNSNGGGAIYYTKSGYLLNITQSNFNDNSACIAGAIRIYAGYTNISYSNFTGNVARTNYGGAIYIHGNVGSSVSYCNFTNNYVKNSYGGAIYWATGNGTLSYCIFINNSATRTNNVVYGGAVCWVDSAVYGNISHCLFNDNYAIHTTSNHHMYGGALHFNSLNGTISYCNFTNNYANNTKASKIIYGGALSVYNTGIRVSYCNFDNNTANALTSGSVYGSAIYVYLGDCTVEYCNFTNNNASISKIGGVIYWDGPTGTLKHCNFEKNSFKEQGAVFWNKADGYIYNVSFIGNKALNGNQGAIRAVGNNLVIDLCRFINNSASGSEGALYWFGSNGVLKNSLFTNNSAGTYGGALSIGNNLNIVNCTFKDNMAKSGYGGAISHYAGSNVIITNCTFINNNATRMGGAIYIPKDNYTVYDCSFINNTAGTNGGAIFISGKNTIINKCKFYNNTAINQGSAIATINVVTISNSDFFDNKVKSINLIVNTTDRNITITFTGGDNYLNAIYSSVDLTFTNVNYWGANGRMNTDRNGYPIRSNNEAGQNITLNLTGVGGNIYLKSLLTDIDGVAVFTGMKGDTYSGSVYHPENTYYTYINESISDWAVGGIFTQLNELIQNSTNGVVNLTSNYIYDSLTDSAFKNGITISEDSLTINGNGFTIDASNLARIFNINADNVVLNNLTLINGYANIGGAVLWNGTSGTVNRSKFYNNTAKNNGSAIYATDDLNIYDSEFLDNVAKIYLTSSLNADGTSADIHFVSGDNYINSIYSTATISGTNVTYWNSTDKVSIDTGFDTTKNNQKLDMEILYKLNQTSYRNVTNVTDSNSNVTISNLTPVEYYSVVVKQSRGSSKFASDVVDVASNIVVTPMELIVSEVVYVGDNLTVTALLADDATGGNITFSANGTFIANASVVNGRASLSINPNLAIGTYELVALYSSDGKYYGQRNVSSFVVRFSSPPIVTVVVSNLSVINTNLTIQAFSNLNLTNNAQILSGLQLVVLSGGHFFRTFFLG